MKSVDFSAMSALVKNHEAAIKDQKQSIARNLAKMFPTGTTVGWMRSARQKHPSIGVVGDTQYGMERGDVHLRTQSKCKWSGRIKENGESIHWSRLFIVEEGGTK